MESAEWRIHKILILFVLKHRYSLKSANLETTSKGEFLKIKNSDYSKDDYFFMAKGSYSLLKTSNNWMNQGLKTAEVETAIWTPFDKGIFYYIENQ